MKNKQVIINSLPEGKLTESNYRLVESEIPEISSDQVLVKTISFFKRAKKISNNNYIPFTIAISKKCVLKNHTIVLAKTEFIIT